MHIQRVLRFSENLKKVKLTNIKNIVKIIKLTFNLQYHLNAKTEINEILEVQNDFRN